MTNLETSILNAVVSSCKLRSDAMSRRRKQARATHKIPRALGSWDRPTPPPTHIKSRDPKRYGAHVKRQPLRDAEVPWEAEVAGGYAPPFYEDPSLEKHRKDLGHGFKWAEPPQSVVVARVA